jgi:hypothetical protein
MTRIVRVTRDQVESARLLIKISGGEDKVDPVFVKIANAQPAQGNGDNDRNSP